MVEMTVSGMAGALGKLRAIPGRVAERLREATRENAEETLAEVRAGIESGAPGGNRLAPLHPWTLGLRAEAGLGARRLLRHGDLLDALAAEIGAGGLAFSVGVEKGAENRDGESLEKIARIMREGITLRVTPRMRAKLHSMGMHLRASTTTIVIPPADFLGPVLRQMRPRWVRRYKDAFVGGVLGR